MSGSAPPDPVAHEPGDLEPEENDLTAVTGGAFDPLEPARLLQGGVVDPSTLRPPRRRVVRRPR